MLNKLKSNLAKSYAGITTLLKYHKTFFIIWTANMYFNNM